MSNEQLVNGIPTEEDLDKMEDIESNYVMSSYKLLSNVDEDDEDEECEDISYLSALCDPENLDALTRNFLLAFNDDTQSKSIEELYLKQVIRGNNKTLEELAKRQMEYEHSRKEQETSADML